MEEGNIPLDEALSRYEEGIKLSRLCQEKLSQAEKKIEILSRNAKGELAKKPFDASEESADAQTPAKARKGRKSSAGEEAGAENEESLF